MFVYNRRNYLYENGKLQLFMLLYYCYIFTVKSILLDTVLVIIFCRGKRLQLGGKRRNDIFFIHQNLSKTLFIARYLFFIKSNIHTHIKCTLFLLFIVDNLKKLFKKWREIEFINCGWEKRRLYIISSICISQSPSSKVKK